MDISQHQLHTESVLKPLVAEFQTKARYPLQDIASFSGAGVYALYLVDSSGTPYDGFVDSQRPIYVGKAVPEGSRQGRTLNAATKKLSARIREHRRSIDAVDLGAERFEVRFAVLSGEGVDLIAALESALIRTHTPLWNSYIDGFGNHDPGSGRYEQSISEWDTLHTGRKWASKLTGVPPRMENISAKIKSY
ncbi:Eco29kI family restriction endonuclease [Vibrio harveyi]|nr:Eco29kI family restriction endonuclease [Vibrio harveyi]